MTALEHFPRCCCWRHLTYAWQTRTDTHSKPSLREICLGCVTSPFATSGAIGPPTGFQTWNHSVYPFTTPSDLTNIKSTTFLSHALDSLTSKYLNYLCRVGLISGHDPSDAIPLLSLRRLTLDIGGFPAHDILRCIRISNCEYFHYDAWYPSPLRPRFFRDTEHLVPVFQKIARSAEIQRIYSSPSSFHFQSIAITKADDSINLLCQGMTPLRDFLRWLASHLPLEPSAPPIALSIIGWLDEEALLDLLGRTSNKIDSLSSTLR